VLSAEKEQRHGLGRAVEAGGETVRDREFPDVTLSHMLPTRWPAAVRQPKQFDVIVTDNLFGASYRTRRRQLTGSLGMLPAPLWAPRTERAPACAV